MHEPLGFNQCLVAIVLVLVGQSGNIPRCCFYFHYRLLELLTPRNLVLVVTTIPWM